MDCEYGACFMLEVRSVLMTCIAAIREILHSKRNAVCGPDVERTVSVGPITLTAHVTARSCLYLFLELNDSLVFGLFSNYLEYFDCKTG
jgi:hypothetical protein